LRPEPSSVPAYILVDSYYQIMIIIVGGEEPVPV
jgi:hypothetical protein